MVEHGSDIPWVRPLECILAARCRNQPRQPLVQLAFTRPKAGSRISQLEAARYCVCIPPA